MEGTYLRTADAEHSISDIAQYFAKGDLQVAGRFIDAAHAVCLRLAQFPESGSLIDHPRWPKGVRRALIPGFHNYVVLYKPFRSTVMVLNVYHSARNISNT